MGFIETLDCAYTDQSDFPYEDDMTIPHFFEPKHLLILKDAVFDSSFGFLYLKRVGVAESTSWIIRRRLRRSAFRLIFSRKIRTDAPVVFVSQIRWNYYHWLIEDLPSILFLKKKFHHLKVYVGSNAPDFVNQTLNHYGISYLYCRGLVTARHTALVTRGSGQDTGWPHRWDIAQVQNDNEHSSEDNIPPKKIYVSRRFSSRSLSFEKILEQKLGGRGFQIFFLENISFERQKALFSEADVVVAPHGAGLANLVFARPGTQVIELFKFGQVNQCYERLSTVCGLDYQSVYVQETDTVETVFQKLDV